MLKRTLLILFLVAITSIQAQQIYFCNSHTEDGKPVDAKNVWDIKPWGSYVYVLFDNEGKNFESQLNYMFVDKLMDGEYKPFDSKAITLKENVSWFAYNYKFTDQGKYKVYLVNQDQREIMSAPVTIQIESSYLNTKPSSSSLYYDGTKIKFCKRVIAGQPINTFSKMSISRMDSTVLVFIDHKESIETSTFVVDVWEKPLRSIEYDKFIESKKYALNPSWDYAFFKYNLPKTGLYKFNIYNANEVLITSGFLDVEE